MQATESEDHPRNSLPKYCRCLIECPDGSDNSTCLLANNAKCFKKMFINEDGDVEVRAGCLASQDTQVDQCNKLAEPNYNQPTDLKCCNNVSMCNDHLVMKLPTATTSDYTVTMEGQSNNLLVIILCSAIFFVLFLAVIVGYCFCAKRREKLRKREIAEENRNGLIPKFLRNGKPVRSAMDDVNSLDLTSSGAGMPLLTQRTISRQIEILEEIGRGRYGTVKLGKWRDENVALKIFFSKDEDSWFRETEIYQTVMLRHENILGFIASDISGANSWTELFLITEYHENGSLYDYLNRYVLTVAGAMKLAYTACCGLAHLHTEITGSGTQIQTQNQNKCAHSKPAIAHRDVKSKNILVKRDGQCCIADMGLAVQYSRDTGKVDIANYEKSRRQGTRRYMAPEVIMQSYHPDSFAAYKAADVYSFALVMWEIANRTSVKGSVDDYHPPYYDVVGNDPDFEEMKKVVVDQNIRPEVLPEWTGHQVMSSYVSTMQECWVSRFESRLTMLRVRKTLSALNGSYQNVANESTASSETDRKPSASSTTLSTASNVTLDDPLIIIPSESPLLSTSLV